MRGLVLIVCLGLTQVYAQQAIDPAYLRQYYQQIAQQAGASQQRSHEATPVYEPGPQEQQLSQQYVQQPQQIRVKDNVNDQIRQQYIQQQQQPRQYQPQQYQIPQVQQPQYAEQAYQAPRAQPQQPKLSRPRVAAPAQQLRQEAEEEQEEYDSNPSYQFGFDVKDDEFTNYQNRKEQRDGGVIKGSYSVVDSDGFIRTVTYTADPKEGFKAEVTRQPTDIVVKIPQPQPQNQAGAAAGPQQQPRQQYQQQVPQQQQQQYRAQPRPRPQQDYQQYQ